MKNKIIFFTLILIPTLYNGCGESPFKAQNSSVLSSNSTEEDNSENSSPTTPSPTGNSNAGPGNTSPKLTPVFMAQGHLGTTMYSCDGGQSWIGYRTLEPVQRCWTGLPGSIECDHQPTAGRGITYGPLGFIATFGWGQPGQVEASLDGQNWEVVQSGSTWAGVSQGNGVYILNATRPRKSSTLSDWTGIGTRIFSINARSIDFVDNGPGYFISKASSGTNYDLVISRDDGETFQRPTTLPSTCGEGQLAYSKDALVLLSNSLCVSLDQGETWTLGLQAVANAKQIVYDGEEFKAYASAGVFRSSNGIDWIQTPYTVNGMAMSSMRPALVSFHKDLGKFVMIEQSWKKWYEDTQYYFSDDGINWTQVDKSSANVPQAPHPMRTITTGFLEGCP